MNPVNNTAIPIKDINSVPQVFTPTPTVNPFDYAAPATQVQNDIFGGVQNAQNQVNQLTEQAKQKSSSIATLESLLGNKSQETVNLYDTTGVTNLYNQLSDLNAQATGLKNEAAAIPIQVQQQALGQGVTDRGIAPIETARLRDNALKALSLGQQYAIVSGNYDKAKNYADQFITAKYSQIEANINARKTDLAALEKYDLTPAQTKLLNAQNAAIKKQEQDLADKKAKDKAISDMLINASSQGAPSTLLERAKLAKTPTEVATILGQYAGDYWATQKIKSEIAKINAEAAKTRAESNKISSELVKNVTGEGRGLANEGLALVNDILNNQEYLNASGRSNIRKFVEAGVVGATDYTNLEAKALSIKNKLLPLKTDADVRKFFGPQMSNSDVKNILSVSTSLDVENQSPKELQTELENLQKTFQNLGGVDTRSNVNQTADDILKANSNLQKEALGLNLFEI